jgi:F-type H+-transporting ATPase subunit b
MIAAFLAGAPRNAAAQPPANPVEAGETKPGAPAGPARDDSHESGAVDIVARLLNFAILAGTLFYLLRSPIATYLADRSSQIRSDLVNAAEMKRAAAAQLEEIDRRMQALPGELEALRTKGAQEIAAEEARIRAAAAAERARLLEEARRDIDLQLKIAERELVSHAADLAIGVATERIKNSITDDDQRRLVDRYVQQLRS